MLTTKKLWRSFLTMGSLFFLNGVAFAENAPLSAHAPGKAVTAWHLIASGGPVVIFLFLMSIAAVASVIYHWKNVTAEKLAPKDFTENLHSLLEMEVWLQDFP